MADDQIGFCEEFPEPEYMEPALTLPTLPPSSPPGGHVLQLPSLNESPNPRLPEPSPAKDTEDSHFQNLMYMNMKDKIVYVTTEPKTVELLQAVMRVIQQIIQSKENSDQANKLLSALFDADGAQKLIDQLTMDQKRSLMLMAEEISKSNAELEEASRQEELRESRPRSRSASIPNVPLASPSLPREPDISINQHLETDNDLFENLKHYPYNEEDDSIDEEQPDILNMPMSPSHQRAPDLSRSRSPSSSRTARRRKKSSRSSRVNTPATPQSIKSDDLQEDDPVSPSTLFVQEDEDDAENYSCCGRSIPGENSIICERCKKWFHTECLIAKFNIPRPEVVFLMTHEEADFENCPRCEKLGSPRKQKRKRALEQMDMASRKRLKIRVGNVDSERMQRYKENGVDWLNYICVKSLLKREYPEEEKISVQRRKCTKLPPDWFQENSFYFETRDVIHLKRRPKLSTIEAQQKCLDEFVRRNKVRVGNMTFKITDSTHVKIYEYLDHHNFEHLGEDDGSPPVYTLDPPNFYHELELAALDVFDENSIKSKRFKERKKVWESLDEKFGVKILSKLSRSIKDHPCFDNSGPFGEYGSLVRKDVITLFETPELVPFRKTMDQKDWDKKDQYSAYIETLKKNNLEPTSFDLIAKRLKAKRYKKVDDVIEDFEKTFRCVLVTSKVHGRKGKEFKEMAKIGLQQLEKLFIWHRTRVSDD